MGRCHNRGRLEYLRPSGLEANSQPSRNDEGSSIRENADNAYYVHCWLSAYHRSDVLEEITIFWEEQWSGQSGSSSVENLYVFS